MAYAHRKNSIEAWERHEEKERIERDQRKSKNKGR